MYSCVNNDYDNIENILYITDKAICVSKEKCIYG